MGELRAAFCANCRDHVPMVLALLDVAEAAETVDDECGVTHAELLNALDRLREVTS